MPQIPERVNNKEIALSDELCICRCSPPPKLIAEQTAKCQIILVVNDESTGQAQAQEVTTPAHLYDEQPQLVGPPIEGVPYFIATLDGRTFSGRTGPGGLLPRVTTEGEGEYHVYWGDEGLHRAQGVKA